MKLQLSMAEFLNHYVSEHGLNDKSTKFFGLVAENIKSSPELHTAIEAAAGNSLLYCIVDTDETAATLINQLEENKLGRMSFIPLNRVVKKMKSIEPTEKVKCLIDQLEFSDEIKSAIQFVFGNTMICNTAQDCIEFQTQEKVRCVTVDGDVLSGKGVVTGGYRNDGILDIINHINETKAQIQELERDFSCSEKDKKVLEENFNTIISEMEKLNTSLAEEEVVYEKQRMENMIKLKKIERARDTLRNKEKAIEDCDKLIGRNNQKLLLLQAELMETQPIDREQIERSKTNLKNLQNDVAVLEKKRLELENRRQLLRNEYQFSVVVTINEMERGMAEIHGGGDQAEVERCKILNINCTRKRKEEQQRKLEKDLNKEQRAEAELLESKKAEYEKRKDDIGKNYDVIMVTDDDLEALLEETMKELRKDQYKGFIEQQESLADRKAEIMETQQTIFDLIDDLDAKKKKQLKEHLKEYLNVPGGKASLVMLKKPYEASQTQTQTQTQMTENTQRKQRTEIYSGISLKVIFPAFGGDAKTIQQLSGGQKTVVALSLIFAIQRCDPAPFYLFDEIDSNLDTVYREAVARLISEQSQEAQYPRNGMKLNIKIKYQPFLLLQKEDALRVIKEEEGRNVDNSTPFQTPQQTPQHLDSSEQLTPNY
ncbi:Structural maintenance of chromosomes protein [Entamoeba marina]